MMTMMMMMFVGGTCSVLFLNVYALFLFSGNKLRLLSFALDREKREVGVYLSELYELPNEHL